MKIEKGQWFWKDVERYIMEKVGYCLMDNWCINVFSNEAEDEIGGWIDVDEIEIDPSSKTVVFSGIYENLDGERYAVEGWWDRDGYWEFDKV